jgi:hypothetical protein
MPPLKGETVVVRLGGWLYAAEYDRFDPVKWGDHPHVVWLVDAETGERGQKHAVRSIVRLGCSASLPAGCYSKRGPLPAAA